MLGKLDLAVVGLAMLASGLASVVQTETSDLGYIGGLVGDIPTVVAFVWLFVKLSTMHESIVSTLLTMGRDERQAMRESQTQLISALAKLAKNE